jgi:hypothetical protein
VGRLNASWARQGHPPRCWGRHRRAGRPSADGRPRSSSSSCQRTGPRQSSGSASARAPSSSSSRRNRSLEGSRRSAVNRGGKGDGLTLQVPPPAAIGRKRVKDETLRVVRLRSSSVDTRDISTDICWCPTNMSAAGSCRHPRHTRSNGWPARSDGSARPRRSWRRSAAGSECGGGVPRGTSIALASAPLMCRRRGIPSS